MNKTVIGSEEAGASLGTGRTAPTSSAKKGGLTDE
jgi:hypothetical protein